VKLLLTSGGITTPSIRAALVDPLGKPVADSMAPWIPAVRVEPSGPDAEGPGYARVVAMADAAAHRGREPQPGEHRTRRAAGCP
jgi:hypothetical protein